MRDPQIRRRAVVLGRSGVRNAEIASRLGVPAGTVGYWLHMDRDRRGQLPGRQRPCARCDGSPLDRAAYSYLLGLYLGDGHIVLQERYGVCRLSITCTESWPGLMDAAEAAMQAVFPHNKTTRVPRTGCSDVRVCSNHLKCFFPQHGPGKKHDRKIALEEWQQEIVDAYPWEFLRGLIHSDGCRITNWTVRTVAGERKRYEYPRYLFTNVSDDIRRLYCDTLDKVGVEWRVTRRGDRPYNVSVARREGVALMDRFIGGKY